MGLHSKLVVGLFSVSLFAGCGSNPPKPSVSEYVKTEGGGFAIQKGTDVKYGITYTLLKSVGESPSIKVEFENPDNKGKSIVLEKEIGKEERKLVISSPLLPCIENNRNYSVVLALYSNGSLVASHKDQIQFSVPGSMLSQLNLTMCNNNA